jgi:hypothetical protein
MGVAVCEVTGALAGNALPLAKIVLVTGEAFIAMQDAADVYLVQQDNISVQALRWLKDKDTAPAFTRIIRALKEKKPLPKNLPPEMVSTARAILDPRLGNSGSRIAWGAMWSPEARKAGIMKAWIALGGELLGHGVEGIAADLAVTRDPAFRYATNTLNRAHAALTKTSDPADQAALQKVIEEANRVIAHSYEVTVHPLASGAGSAASIFAADVTEEKLRGEK